MVRIDFDVESGTDLMTRVKPDAFTKMKSFSHNYGKRKL